MNAIIYTAGGLLGGAIVYYTVIKPPSSNPGNNDAESDFLELYTMDGGDAEPSSEMLELYSVPLETNQQPLELTTSPLEMYSPLMDMDLQGLNPCGLDNLNPTCQCPSDQTKYVWNTNGVTVYQCFGDYLISQGETQGIPL